MNQITNGHTARLLGRFQHGAREIFGEVKDGHVFVLENCSSLAEAMEATSHSDSASCLRLDQVTWLPPLDPAARVLAVALNYRPHADETGQTPPERPIVFYKPPTAFVGQNGTLQAHPSFTSKYDYEGEVGVVIGRRCYRATREDALSYVGGVCALMDGSSRDRLRVTGGQNVFLDWLSSKCADEASMIGPGIACGPAVIDSLRNRSVTLETRLNGEVVQQGSIAEMVFSTEDLIVALSEFMTLLPGDVIATGTPGGIGQARGRFVTSGDSISIAVSGLPPLEARVA
jgi:2-keto-4-pentenoate hydratase/2-oxohepta-3-ene-1,7-dioic acid hydratase in catechol pathway